MKSATISFKATSLHHQVSGKPVNDFPRQFGAHEVTHDRKAPAVHLTPRQLEVLSLLCEGLPNKLICRRLNIAAGTVKVHMGVILRELGVTSRLQAVVAASRRGPFEEFGESAPAQAHPSAPAESPMMLRMIMDGMSPRSAQGRLSLITLLG